MQTRLKIFAFFWGISLVLVLGGCPGTPDKDNSIDHITITDIPAGYYKIYVSASNSQDDKDPHVSQGAELIDGKTSVEVKLYAPPAKQEGVDPDPDEHGDAWSGEADFFSVAITPQEAKTAAAIQVKAGLTLDSSKETVDWGGLIDLRVQSMVDKIEAVYTRIVCNDDAIVTK